MMVLSARRSMRQKCTFIRCSLDVIFSFLMLDVISTHDDLHFVSPYLSIYRPWELINVLRYAFDLPLSYLCSYFCQISGCQQPCKFLSNNHGYGISISAYFISYDSRVGAPEWKSRNMFTHIVELTQRTRPVASCSRFRGSLLESSHRYTPSMRRTTVVVLHSMGCFSLSLFSCLVVAKLLLVLLLL
jgi:hypothetical protein